MKTRFVMMAALLMAAAEVLAQGGRGPGAWGKDGERGPRGPRPPRPQFEKIDADGNGVLDRDEFPGPDEAFDRIDADGSGTLTEEEMRAAGPPPHGRPPRFNQIDADGNGVVDRDEFPGPDEAFDRIDADGDGLLTQEELRAGRPPRDGRPPRFDQIDADGNGVVDRDEFPGPDEAFDRIDADGDGLLTQEELRAGRPPRGGRRAGGREKDDLEKNGEGSYGRRQRGPRARVF